MAWFHVPGWRGAWPGPAYGEVVKAKSAESMLGGFPDPLQASAEFLNRGEVTQVVLSCLADKWPTTFCWDLARVLHDCKCSGQ